MVLGAWRTWSSAYGESVEMDASFSWFGNPVECECESGRGRPWGCVWGVGARMRARDAVSESRSHCEIKLRSVTKQEKGCN
jgi:hypothetical protein